MVMPRPGGPSMTVCRHAINLLGRANEVRNRIRTSSEIAPGTSVPQQSDHEGQCVYMDHRKMNVFFSISLAFNFPKMDNCFEVEASIIIETKTTQPDLPVPVRTRQSRRLLNRFAIFESPDLCVSREQMKQTFQILKDRPKLSVKFTRDSRSGDQQREYERETHELVSI